MLTPTIKTHKPGTPYEGHHFFILSKGLNTGKPLESPCPNCFVISMNSEDEKKKVFWVCYGLWKSGRFLPFLCGSVIEFIHIRDLKSIISEGLSHAASFSETFLRDVLQLQRMIRHEKILKLQLKLLAELKQSTCENLFRIKASNNNHIQ